MFCKFLCSLASLSTLLVAHQSETQAAAPTVHSPTQLMWQVHHSAPPGTFAFLHRCGIDTIHSFSFAHWSEDKINTYLARANKSHLRVIAYIGSLLETNEQGQKIFGSTAKQFIRRWQDQPAIGYWHFVDEPKQAKFNMTGAQQKEIYQQIKQLDPKRPVLVTTNVVKAQDFQRFFDDEAFDVLGIHAYPDPIIRTRQRLQARNFARFKTRTYPMFYTVRAFNLPDWKVLPAGAIRKQAQFVNEEYGAETGIGYYGWGLDHNAGLAASAELLADFRKFRGEICAQKGKR